LVSTLLDIYEESNNAQKLDLAIEYCDTLIKGLDDIHKKYWIWRKNQLEKQKSQCK